MSSLARFPWATLGRAELPGEYFQKIEEQKTHWRHLTVKPRFHLIVVLEDARGLGTAHWTWESLVLQSYPEWEAWVMVDDATADQLTLPSDPRFRLVRVPQSAADWEKKNQALERVASGWVGTVGLGDVLAPSALFQIAVEMTKQPTAIGFYTHEASVDPQGRRAHRFVSKRAYSSLTQAHWNSVGRFWVAKRETLVPLEALPAGTDEQVALLRAGNQAPLGNLPFTLYYRAVPAPIPAPNAVAASAIERTLAEQGARVRVETQSSGGRSRLRVWPVPEAAPRVSAILCFRDKAELTLKALRSLLRVRDGADLEVLLVDNDSSPGELEKITSVLPTFEVPVRLVHFPGPFNYGRMHNWAVREHCRGRVLLLLNNDVELAPSGSLTRWIAWATRPDVATVGILLRFANGAVQYSGIRAWFGGEARLARVSNSHANDDSIHETREVFANTFAACVVRRDAFEALGGLRETELVNGFGDVAFCFEAVRRGWRHVFLGGMEGTHAESTSRGVSYEYWEEFGVEREYPDILQKLLREDFGVDRVPAAEGSLSQAVVQALRVQFRQRARWLDPLKPTLKKWVGPWVTSREGC